MKDLPLTLHDMLNSQGWDCFIGDRLGNDLFINDPERAARIYDASESGADGSTHAEHIQDQRDFLDILREEAAKSAQTDEEEDYVQDWFDRLSEELDEIENFHDGNGSLHEEVG